MTNLTSGIDSRVQTVPFWSVTANNELSLRDLTLLRKQKQKEYEVALNRVNSLKREVMVTKTKTLHSQARVR